jgi:hypothetical protein
VRPAAPNSAHHTLDRQYEEPIEIMVNIPLVHVQSPDPPT